MNMNKIYISCCLTVDVRGVLIIIIIIYLKYIFDSSEFSEENFSLTWVNVFFFSKYILKYEDTVSITNNSICLKRHKTINWISAAEWRLHLFVVVIHVIDGTDSFNLQNIKRCPMSVNSM